MKMKVSVKDLSVEMELKNQSVALDVFDNKGNHLGALVAARTGLTWCRGKTKAINGTKLNWPKAIEMFEGTDPKATKKAAKKKAVKKAAKSAAAPKPESSGSGE
jgi:hypothetical protein